MLLEIDPQGLNEIRVQLERSAVRIESIGPAPGAPTAAPGSLTAAVTQLTTAHLQLSAATSSALRLAAAEMGRIAGEAVAADRFGS